MGFVVIMAGGRGERFWPRSTMEMPKQFHRIVSSRTMLQEAFYRVYPEFGKDEIFIVAGESFKGIILEQIGEIDEKNLIVEPFGRDTAPAIALAATYLSKIDPDANMMVLTADHLVEPKDRFLKSVEIAEKVADDGYLVTFGIKPDRPATEYGYIELGERIMDSYGGNVYRVKMFREKPDLKTAEEFLKNGRFLWNSGMFCFKVSIIMDAFSRYMPELYAGLTEISDAIGTDAEKSVIERSFKKFPKISIDYGVMEKADKIACIMPEFAWDDVGSWVALERHMKKDPTGSIIEGNVLQVDSKNNIVLNDDESIIGIIGVEDMIIVKEHDRILICAKRRSQDIKALIKRMSEHEEFKKFM